MIVRHGSTSDIWLHRPATTLCHVYNNQASTGGVDLPIMQVTGIEGQYGEISAASELEWHPAKTYSPPVHIACDEEVTLAYDWPVPSQWSTDKSYHIIHKVLYEVGGEAHSAVCLDSVVAPQLPPWETAPRWLPSSMTTSNSNMDSVLEMSLLASCMVCAFYLLIKTRSFPGWTNLPAESGRSGKRKGRRAV
ncbi:unnamed protein product [Chrysoparadoxa australica]